MIVIDASALTDVLVGRPEARDQIRTVLPGRGEAWLHAPELVEVEVLNALRGLARASAISARRGLEAVNDLARARVKRYPHGPFRRRIWALRDQVSAYDAAYLALAEALDATLLTSDAGLAARARASLGGDRVRQFA